jgi:hypothetical protein
VKRTLSTALVGAAAVVSVVFAAATPASADSTPAPSAGKSLASIQATAQARTSQRTTSLNTALGKVNAATGLTSGDRDTILGILNGDLSGMTTIEAKIAADTTVKQARADDKTIFTSYRIYLVALPQARDATAADSAISVSLPKLTTRQSTLAALLTGKDSSKSTPALQADLADMTAEIGKASSALSGVSAAALAATPSGYNSNHDILASSKTSLATARAAIKQARTDAKTVAAAIRAH